jgi:hypothetical protein
MPSRQSPYLSKAKKGIVIIFHVCAKSTKELNLAGAQTFKEPIKQYIERFGAAAATEAMCRQLETRLEPSKIPKAAR